MGPPDFTLTILGAGPAMPNPGGACSGYLARQGTSNLLVDCGPGVAGRLAQQVRPQELDAVVLSHLHADHHFDVVPLYYGLKYGERRPAARGLRLPLFVPPGGATYLRRLGELLDGDSAMFDDVYTVEEYAADRELAIGSFHLTFHPVQHYILSHAMRIRAEHGRLLVFSSDVGPCAELVEAARGADLFLCESTLVDRSQDHADPRRRGHLLASEAGAAARDAGARRLLITHYRANDAALAPHHRSSAASAFAGPVELAVEGTSYTV